MRFQSLLPALLVPVAGAAAHASAAGPGDIVARMEQAYGGLRDLSADFTQVAESQALGRRVAEKGSITLRRPGFMRWEYHAPEEKLFIARGESTWFYVPADNQVIQTPRQAIREAGVGALLLDGAPSFAEAYEITPEPTGGEPLPPGQVLLRFRPLAERAAFQFALVSVDEGDAIARRIVVVDAAGNRTEYLFEHVRPNAGVDPVVFDWDPPAGVEIVER